MQTLVRRLLLVVACCSWSGIAAAEELDFEIAVRDINGDGQADVFVRVKPQLIPFPIAGSVVLLPMPKPGAPRFVLVQQPSGGFATEFIQLEE
jgi:hypothetical protein